MCGIVGYAGSEAASGRVYEGLKKLEYRGYDSAGIATLSDGRIYCEKRCGRVYALDGKVRNLSGNVGIGHTRWATHGKPSDINAHPHVCGKFAVVHNGIIENYDRLGQEYFGGENFVSDTDSEIIVRLLDKFYSGELLTAVNKVCGLLSGSYAFAVICADSEEIAVAKSGSPAVIGFGKDGNYIASDCNALAGICGRVSLLEDGDVALVTREGASVFDKNLQGVIRPEIANPAVPASLSLNGCAHYMLKEIRETPASVADTADAYRYVGETVKDVLRGTDNIAIVGCGTAYNSGLVAKRYFENFARIPVQVETAGEFRYKNPVIDSNTAVIAISQSGETADTLEAAKLSRRLGAKVIAVTNSPCSQLTRCADAVVPVVAGPEISVAATKSYTGQITALYLIAATLAGERYGQAVGKIMKMRELCECAVRDTDIEMLADMCARSYGTYFMGRDIDYAVALEGSLKLKEVSYVPSEGYPAGELKHGTLALIDLRTVSVFVITDARLAEKSANGVEQVLSRRGKVAVITNVDAIAQRFKDRATVITVPACDEYLSPLVSVIPLQLLAYRCALLLDRDPDKPRNLAKSVTVE